MRNRKTYVRGDLLASHRLWVGYGWTRTRFWDSWDQNHIGDFLLVQRCTFICDRPAAPTSRRRLARLLSSPFSLAARWRPPPRLRHRGDRLHRSRHVKARLLTYGTLRCVRPCARTLILAGPANASPACCERQAGSAGAHECSEMYRGRQGLITSSGEPGEQLRRSLSVTQDAPKLLPFALGRCSADVPILEELQRQRLRSVFEP